MIGTPVAMDVYKSADWLWTNIHWFVIGTQNFQREHVEGSIKIFFFNLKVSGMRFFISN